MCQTQFQVGILKKIYELGLWKKLQRINPTPTPKLVIFIITHIL